MHRKQVVSYDIIQESDTDFRFTTENGCIYSIKLEGADYLKSISPNLFIYEFSFAKATGTDNRFDPKIKSTITNLIEGKLKNTHVTLFYVCETIDGKEDYRKRLFDRWFSKHDTNSHTVHTYPIRSEYAESTIYISVIISNENPYYNDVVSELNKTLNGYTGDK